MVDCYPNGGHGAGRGYTGALASILVAYPAMIARLSADPLRGVPRETKFLPTPADLIAWCERQTAELRKPVEREDSYAAQRKVLEDRRLEDEAIATDRPKRLTYAQLRAKYGQDRPDWGIGLSDPFKPIRKPGKTYTDAELRAIYAKPTVPIQDDF